MTILVPTPLDKGLESTAVVRLDVATLEGMYLNWAVSRFDPRNEGLTLRAVSGVLCGVDEGDPSPLVCIFFSAPGWRAQSQAKRRLGRLGEHAMHYNPAEDWLQAGLLLEKARIALAPDGATAWKASAGPIELRNQPSATVALLRVFVLLYAGNQIELPAELVPFFVG